MSRSQLTRYGTILLAATCATGALACRGGGGKATAASRWVDKPTPGKKDGNIISFEDLGVKFETPDTLYVYKSCGEASHAPEGENKWVPIITCQTTGTPGGDVFGGGGGDDELTDEDFESDFGSADEEEFSTGAESLSMTFYVTKKTRPLDERSVSWFENQYKQAGLNVDDVSYQHDYQKKTGIYAKLQVMNSANGMPTHEIVQFMFPRKDVVFIARIEYPFGETRSVMTDWKYILWNFDIDATDD